MLLLVVIILFGLIMGVLRLSLANIELYKAEVEYLLSELVVPGIVINNVRGDWNRFNPVIRIDNASVNLPDRSQPLFVDNLVVEFDLWASLREQTPVVLEIAGQLEKLELSKDRSGRWWANEFEIGGDLEEAVERSLEQVLVLVPRYLNLQLHRLIINDESSDSVYQLERVSAHLNHRRNQFFVQLSAALPESLGRSVEIKSVITSNRSVVYLNGDNLQWQQASRLFGIQQSELKSASLTGEIWFNLVGYRIISVNGELSLDEGVIDTSKINAPLEFETEARFTLVNGSNRWQVRSEVNNLRLNQQAVPGFRNQLEISHSSDEDKIALWVDRLELNNLPAIAAQIWNEEPDDRLAIIQPTGAIENLYFEIDLDNPADFKASADAVQISSQPYSDIPGVTNLNGRFIVGNNKVSARLAGENMRLDFADNFRKPIDLDRFELSALAASTDTGLLLSVDDILADNEDIHVAARLWLESDQYKQPFFYIRGSFKDGVGRTASNYLPVKIMPAATVKWIDRGIREASIPRGDFLFHGRLLDIKQLNDEAAGELFVEFDLENADVFFAPRWLSAKQGRGKIQFHNMSMNIDLDQVNYDQLQDVRATVAIADYAESELVIDIVSNMSTANAMQTWLDTPVGSNYRTIMSNLDTIDGRVRSNIEIKLALNSDDQNERVKVTLNFEESSARSERWGLDLSRIRGDLQINESGVFSGDLRANFFDAPVNINISSNKDSGDTLVKARGVIATNTLFTRLPDAFGKAFSGKSLWNTGLTFVGGSEKSEPVVRLSLASELENSVINLPAPFTKNAGSTNPVRVSIDFFDDKFTYFAELGSDIKSKGVFSGTDNSGYSVDSIDIAFNEPLNPGNSPGIKLYGNLPYLSADDWISEFSRQQTGDSPGLQSAALNLAQVSAFGHLLEQVKLDIEQVDDGHIALIDSSLAKGSIRLPGRQSANRQVVVDLEYLRLKSSDHSPDVVSITPSDFFDARINSARFSYDEMVFRDLAAEISVVGEVLEVKPISLRNEQVYLNATVQWDYSPETRAHKSAIDMVVQGKRFGQTMSNLGFGDSIADGNIDFNASINWKSALLDFDWESLEGTAKLTIEDGVLNNVEPGSGRLVGLLSLSALPRRLSLDFKDMLVKGMPFDKISGNYKIEGENLKTSNTKLDGTSAKIDISGITGMRRRDYDQTMVVTPKIRQTLPLIGAVSAGSGVGWGLLLLQNLFKKAIDKVVEIKYEVTGSWEEPIVTLIEAVENNDTENFNDKDNDSEATDR